MQDFTPAAPQKVVYDHVKLAVANKIKLEYEMEKRKYFTELVEKQAEELRKERFKRVRKIKGSSFDKRKALVIEMHKAKIIDTPKAKDITMMAEHVSVMVNEIPDEIYNKIYGQ